MNLLHRRDKAPELSAVVANGKCPVFNQGGAPGLCPASLLGYDPVLARQGA